MRLLLLSDAISPHTENWANYLARAGNEVMVLSFTPVGKCNYDANVRIKTLGLQRSYRKFDILKLILLANFWSLRFWPRFVNAKYATTYGTIGLFVLFRPLITSVWGSDILVRPVRSKRIRWLMKVILRRSRAVFATSKVLSNAAQTFTHKPIFVVPFGVDEAIFQYQEKPQNPQEIHIGCVKWMKHVYGMDLLLQAMAMVRNEFPAIKFSIYLCGDGPEQTNLEVLARQLGLQEQVVFTGRLDQAAVVALQQRLDIAVYPSRSESFGVSIIESQASGTPVIGSRIGGIPEVIEENITGLLFEPGNVVALASSISTLVADPEYRAKLADAALLRVKEKFTWQAAITRYLAIGEFLTSGHGQLNYLVDENEQSPLPKANPHPTWVLAHYPGDIYSEELSINGLLMQQQRQSFEQSFACLRVDGSRVSKRRQYAWFRYMVKCGVKFDFCYSDVHRHGAMLNDNLRSVDLSVIDFRLWLFCKRSGIPLLGHWQNDVWQSKEYLNKLGKKKRLFLKLWRDLDGLVLSWADAKRIEANSESAEPATQHPLVRRVALGIGQESKAMIAYDNADHGQAKVLLEQVRQWPGYDIIRMAKKNSHHQAFSATAAILGEEDDLYTQYQSLLDCRTADLTVLHSEVPSALDDELLADNYLIRKQTAVTPSSCRAQLRHALFSRLFDNYNGQPVLLYVGGFDAAFDFNALLNGIADQSDVLLAIHCPAILARQRRELVRAAEEHASIALLQRSPTWLANNGFLFDVGCLIYKPTDYLVDTVPPAFASLLSFQLPLLGTMGSAVGDHIKQYQLGWCCAYSTEAIGAVIKSLPSMLADKVSLASIQSSCQTYVAENTWARRNERLLELAALN